jgi:beta-glucosidase
MWDEFAHKSGRIADGSTGDVACDHYHRVGEDIAMMKRLGHDAYRFSVAWPRVIPQGRGAVNAKGLDFYDRLVDQLLAQGITPYATLYHWDLPLALHQKGGWLERDTAHAFAEFADVVSQRLGDRVYSYATLNEPRCSATVGYLEGRHAPGLEDRSMALLAAHHLMLAHGLAVPALRRNTRTAKVGIVLDIKPYYPADDTAQTHAAAHLADGVFNRWFMDPLFLSQYPKDVWQAEGNRVPQLSPAQLADDLKTICQPIDSLGLNYYTRGHVAHDASKPFPHVREVKVDTATYTTMGWEVFAPGLQNMLERIHREYPVKDMFIAENGAALNDVVTQGAVHDPIRVEYFQSHVAAVGNAMQNGVPMSAYFAWSLMDNYEWGKGYTQRFGICHVDYATQVRTPKDSALWLRDFFGQRKV